MATLNKVFLMGRLTRDPELRYTPQGIPVTDLGLAVNREFTPQGGGEKRKDTLFIDATLWRKQAELCCQYLKKGQPIFIEGRLAMDSWEGQDGQKRTRIRVVAENFQFLGGGGGRGGAGEPPPPDAEESERPPPAGDYGSSFRRSPAPAEDRPPGGAGNGEVEAPKGEDIPF